MATRKSLTLLPGTFRTPTNEKFLSATLDQLISEPNLKNLFGYIGRQFAPTYQLGDSYVIEDTKERQDYQLEPTTIIKDTLNNTTFLATYIDTLNEVQYYGGLINDDSRLFASEYYSYDPHIEFDTFVNFSQYYWLPNGPSKVEVNTSGVQLETDYTVTRNDNTNTYDYTDDGTKNNTLVLARGGTYTFKVNQAPAGFWIQSELGTDGLVNATPTQSSRDVLGVTNNGEEEGTVTFNVPQKNAQDRFIAMTTVQNVDFALPVAFDTIQNTKLTDFVALYPEYAGLAGTLDGKTGVFVKQDLLVNSETNWTVSGEDSSGTYSLTYPKGSTVPTDVRYNVWKIQLLPYEDTFLINLYDTTVIPQEQKVYIKYGIFYANFEFYKEFTGFLEPMPLITATADYLFVQDSLRSDIYTTLKIVEFNDFEIDVDTDILGQLNYTSPNGVAFTSGLKIKFDNDVTPITYQQKTYYVENVGVAIRLVDETLLVKPEAYNTEIATNYPLQQIILNKATNAIITAGTNLTIGTLTIEVANDVSVSATKIETYDSVAAITKGLTVTGTGIPSGTQVYDAFAAAVFPEYITSDRSSLDLNAWARNNCWCHQQVIIDTAKYNSDVTILDQDLRAKRPIIQFKDDIQLFNNGRIGKTPVQIIDTQITNAFEDLEGKVSAEEFGVTLYSGMRVIFAADQDPLVKDKIYDLTLVQYEVDSFGRPSGDFHIKLVKASDGDLNLNDTVVATEGQSKGQQYWYDGTVWILSQQKTLLQQDPLYDIVNDSGTSLSDVTAYPRSTFDGTKLFGYVRATTGTDDAVLGFPLSYRSFTSQGDILFLNYFNTDTFNYVTDNVETTRYVNQGFLQSITDSHTVTKKNTWVTVIEPSRQYQQFKFTYQGTNSFALDITANEQTYQGTSNSIPYLKVFKNEFYLKTTDWTVTAGIDGRSSVSLNTTPNTNDVIDILVYSSQVSDTGFYGVPLNLDNNAQNTDLTDITLGTIRNHVVGLNRNSTTVVGDILGSCNLRDIEVRAQGGTILQHSAPIPYAELFLMDSQANFTNGIQLAQREYTKFRNKFLELCSTISGLDHTNPSKSVDTIMQQINIHKTSSDPWFYSDMVPYSTLRNTINYIVFDTLTTSYELSNVFSSTTLSNKAVLVYKNNVQLVLGIDYVFDTTRPAVTFDLTNITFAVDDVITIVEITNTDGTYVPETPTKLGLYPKFVPELVADDTYQSTINVVRGHDGSITPAFNDFRDSFLLELEKRIFNNIKLPDTDQSMSITNLLPGKFRTVEENPYSYDEVWQVLSNSFLTWVGANRVDFSTNSTFENNGPFTWNFSRFVDRLDQEYMKGSWRAVYQFYYDTIYPHQRPWEMLGFSIAPSWWTDYYGPAPYTGANDLLWTDLEAGRIRQGPRSLLDLGEGVGIDPRYVRPKLTQVIPVDENGYLISPEKVIAQGTNAKYASGAWAPGQLGPTEWAWMSSVDFPFAMQQAASVLTPAVYFGQFVDTYKVQKNHELNQYLVTTDNHHIRQSDINFNGGNVYTKTSAGVTSMDVVTTEIYRGAGYINYIADNLRNLGINPTTKIKPMLRDYNVKLAYKMAGFSDKKYLKVLAEQSSPNSTANSVLLPDENYDVVLYKSTPTSTITYSAVIIEKTNLGYSVRGYDTKSPFFTIIPSVVNNNATSVTVQNLKGTIYNNYQDLKINTPYGYEFTTPQQVVDFLISYERFLEAQGFRFDQIDDDLAELRSFKLSVKEFLFWAQQGWNNGSLLILSPVTNSISVVTDGVIVDAITDESQGSRVIDQNFNVIKNTGYTVQRSATNFNVSLTTDNVLALVVLNLVQYEHVLTFDNVTVFNDVIYQPQLGNRQYRLKLVGQKTAEWDGSLFAPGFIYNNNIVPSWAPGQDYLKGDLVDFKSQYYVALQDVAGTTEFSFVLWKQISQDEIQTGLLTNFQTLAVQSQSYYDDYGKIKNETEQDQSNGLIGFKKRQWFEDLGMSDTTQVEFYKGYIKQKGTANAINGLKDATFNNISGNISFYEEWAMRTGEYGALGSNPYVEIPLEESAFSVNPAIAQFVDTGDAGLANDVTIFSIDQTYRKSDSFNANIALNRTSSSDYEDDILTAGYVNIDDISTTIFDIKTYTDLDANLSQIGSGYTIWCAKDFDDKWNVFRVTETDNQVVGLVNELDGYISWTTNTPHGLSENDVFVIQGFSTEFDGFYQVYSTPDLETITVNYFGDADNLTSLTTLTAVAPFYKLASSRFEYMEDARIYGLSEPINGWKVGDKIWIDTDAETTTATGQSYDTESGTWKVYEKTEPWDYDQTLLKASTSYKKDDGFGKSVKLSYDGLTATIGSPFANSTPYSGGSEEITGVVNVFAQNFQGNFEIGTQLIPYAGNAAITNREFGYSIDQANPGQVVVGSPGSYGNIGFVYVYNRAEGTSNYDVPQIVWSGNLSATRPTMDRFGEAVSVDQNGTWLYVGAPGSDKVYVYGRNDHVTLEKDTISINNRNTLSLSGNTFTASPGDHITMPSTGGEAIVLEGRWTNNSNIIVDNLSGFTGTGNIFINSIDSSTNIAAPNGRTYTISNINIITTSFTPNCSLSAESLKVSNSNRVFIANLDYTLNGTTITFKNNLVQDTYVIEQAPYYSLANTIQGEANSKFGSAVDCSLDGAQLGVGAPSGNVFARGGWQANAGSVFMYDRTIEAFNTTGLADYITTEDIDLVHRVTVEDVEVDNYFLPSGIGTNTLRFINPPASGQIVKIETNKLFLLETLSGVTTLEGNTSTVQANAAFGTSLTICSNNCAIYIGAPYYNNGTAYGVGAVWKFHNRGTLYGTNTGFTFDPTFTAGDTLRLNNFEVTVSGRMMPGNVLASTVTEVTSIPLIYATSNVLTLSSNVRANVGDLISQDLGSAYYANVTVMANTAGSGSRHLSTGGNIKLGGSQTGNLFTFNSGTIRVKGVSTTAFPVASIDSLVKDVNDANILGISSESVNYQWQLNSTTTTSKNLMRINAGQPSGSDGVLADADMRVFAFMQIILNPYNTVGENFGSKVVLAQNAYMLVIGSEKGTTKGYTTFDTKTMVLDQTSTRFFDSISGSGSVYVYELYDDPRNEVEQPGRYAFAQQLNSGQLNPGDQFGTAVDTINGYILVSAPGDDTTLNDAGSVYIFNNPTMQRGWDLIRYQQPQVDVNSVNRLYLYNSLENEIHTNLQFIDPAKGKIVGQADQDISFKTEYDPAVYNKGKNANTNYYWGTVQVGQVWWNLEALRYIDYEQGSLTYRSINWGRLFPGSVVEICEWVESTVLPSQYVENGGEGVPKFADDSHYVEITQVDETTNIIISKYYYWVTDKTSVDPNNDTRNLPIVSIANLIENPKEQGISYAAIIQQNAVTVYNVSQYLSASNTILHIDYDYVINTNIIHSEYDLVQKKNPDSLIPSRISDKMIDSLSGIDSIGDVVPDPKLSVADRYGIFIRPRQGMFIDRLRAMTDLILYVNSVLIKKPIARQYDLTGMLAQEAKPSLKLGEYDLEVDTEIDLEYINTTPLATGYKVLVNQNTEQDNLWTLHSLNADKTWEIIQVQSYKSSLYWSYIDWYATGFGPDEFIEFVVETLPDVAGVGVRPGDEVLVKVANGQGGGWNLLTVAEDGTYVVVGIENGTIKLNETLGDFNDNGIGFGNQGYSANRFDQSPNIEIRYIIEALQNDIFINELQGEFNNLFFVMINYLFSEQKNVDWIFKSSFLSVTHFLRELTQPPDYIRDNTSYYQSYIEEIKPYRTKIREYITEYKGDDTYQGSTTDFDLPSYYDPELKRYRSPDGTYPTKDTQLWSTGYLNEGGVSTLINEMYPQWYQNRNFHVSTIIITNPGQGYANIPTVTVSGGGQGNANMQATATATIDGDTGTVTSITVVTEGSGYYLTPTVTINGSSSIPAEGYAVLENNDVRTFDSTLKFDRITYDSSVQNWQSNTFFEANTIVSYLGEGYKVTANLTTGIIFNPGDYTVYSAELFNNANDRIMAYYDPQDDMPAKDLKQLIHGIDYPGVKVTGIPFNQGDGFAGSITANVTFNAAHGLVSGHTGNLIIQPEADVLINFANAITANVGQFITQDGSLANVTVYGNTVQNGTFHGNIVNSLSGYFLKNNNNNFNTTGNLFLDGAPLAANVFVANLDFGGAYTWSNSIIRPISSTIGGNTQIAFDVVDASISVTKVWSSVKVQGTIQTTADFISGYTANTQANVSYRGGNVQVDGIWKSAYPLSVDILSSTAGTRYDTSVFDNVEYDEDGIATSSSYDLDTIIRSTYAGAESVEEIDVDGGEYVDTYGSHAPQELIPGRTFDSLEIVTYTKINQGGNIANVGNVIAYRLWDNMVDDTVYTRVSDSFSTWLTTELTEGGKEDTLTVDDASRLTIPNAGKNTPGVIWLGAERITYWSVIGNTLGQVRRGTQGTAQGLQTVGTRVVDGSKDQIVPSSALGNVTLSANTTYVATTFVPYILELSANLQANVGDIITQASGGNVTVIGGNSIAKSIWVNFNGTDNFTYSNVVVTLSGNVSANVGDVITQPSSDANAQVSISNAGKTSVQIRYNGITPLSLGTGNIIAINGSNVTIFPTNSNAVPVLSSNLTVKGSFTNVYPIARTLQGNVTPWVGGGNVTIGKGSILTQTNSWYSAGANTATDGRGFDGDTTSQILFLKAAYADGLFDSLPDLIITEDAINTISTEDGTDLLEGERG